MTDLTPGVALVDGQTKPLPGTDAAPAALPAVQPLTELQAVEALVSALSESRGWLRDYSRSIILDAIERKAVAPLSDAKLLEMWREAVGRALAEEHGEAHEFYARAIERALSAVQPAKGKP